MQDRPRLEIVFLGVGTVSDFFNRGVVQDFEFRKIFQACQESRNCIRILDHCCYSRICVDVDEVTV